MTLLSANPVRSMTSAAPQEGTETGGFCGKLTWARVLWALGISIIFTLLVTCWSQDHGRLSTLANWDDSMYLSHGWLSAATLQERGILKFLGFERSWPPHSIYVDLQCMAGFLLLGFRDSSPYYFSFVSIAPALLLLGMLARWKRFATAATWMLFLATPMAFQMVHMVKADVACGVWFVLGAALLLDSPLISMPLSELGLRLLPFFIAVLCRPLGLIYLGPLFAVCWLMAWTRDWLASRVNGQPPPVSVALKRMLLPAVGLVVLAPYYCIAYRWFRGYFTDAYIHRAFYSPPRPLSGEITYYFEPRIYHDSLGIAILVSIPACVALVVAARGSRGQSLRGTAGFWLASTGIAWLGLTVAYYKTPLVGSTFYFFLFCAIPILWGWLEGRPGQVLLAGVVLAGIVCAAGRTQWSDPTEWYGQGRSDPRTQTLSAASARVIEIARKACLRRSNSTPLTGPHNLKLRVFFTSDAFLNAQNFEYEMAKAGYWKVNGFGLDFSGDLNEHIAEACRADLVVGCDGGANWPFPGNRPAESLQDAVLTFLKADPQFKMTGQGF